MRLLDLFCGAGGAAMGYHRAGFDEIVGVDIKPQPRYPFTFVHGDALEYVREHGREFDAIHASPPCQAYSTATKDRSRHPDLYVDTRAELSGFPVYAIENVIGAPYIHGVMLCGSMVGLKNLRRHRNFETSILIMQPLCSHKENGQSFHITSTAFISAPRHYPGHSWQTSFAHASQIMGISWMTRYELGQAIPPAYAEFIGRQLLAALTSR